MSIVKNTLIRYGFDTENPVEWLETPVLGRPVAAFVIHVDSNPNHNK